MLMIRQSVVMLDLVAVRMHVRQAKDRGQGFRHALKGHPRNCEGEQNSCEPEAVHSVNPNADCNRLRVNYPPGTLDRVKFSMVLTWVNSRDSERARYRDPAWHGMLCSPAKLT